MSVNPIERYWMLKYSIIQTNEGSKSYKSAHKTIQLEILCIVIQYLMIYDIIQHIVVYGTVNRVFQKLQILSILKWKAGGPGYGQNETRKNNLLKIDPFLTECHTLM